MLKRLALLLMFTIGCNSSATNDSHHHENPSSAETDNTQIGEGCKHLVYGPDLSLNLTTPSPNASAVHTRYQVTLKPSADDPSIFEGVFQYTATASRYYFLSDQPITLSITDSAGNVITPSAIYTAPIENCEQARVVSLADLTEQTYTVPMDESPLAELQLVIHVLGATHDHGH
jgi:hypothetical protein